jgi:17beta-estradiol 17-dehydrogenase / very-long-chain 3-oxoacyl-CoA reductase
MDIVTDFFFTEKCQTTKNIAALVGVAYIASVIVKNLWVLKGGIMAYVLTPLTRTNLKKFGAWAVVTGASDGIGKAYAKELAKQGLNIVLLSRTQSKLDAVAQEIRDKYKVETKVVAVDFCRGQDLYDEIRDHLDGLDIGVLVNNVGMAYEFPMYLDELPEQDAWRIMICNTASVTMMTKMVLPGMLKKKKGVIVNISSGFAQVPAPLVAVYTATKAYVDFFSKSLQAEYSSKGIIVQGVLPHVVMTNMSKVRRSGVSVPTPETYVRNAVGTIGTLSNTNGYWMHSLQGYMVDLLPEWLAVRLVSPTLHALRKRGLKRKEKGK